MDPTRCVILGGEEDSLIDRAARWQIAAGVGSAALSWWRRPVPFSYPVLIGDVRIGSRIGAQVVDARRQRGYYGPLTTADPVGGDLIELLRCYLSAWNVSAWNVRHH